MASKITTSEATIEDLYSFDRKVELVGGRINVLPYAEAAPGFAADEIMCSLWSYAKQTGRGRAVGDNSAFLVELPNRKSISPNAAFYLGPPAGMSFFSEPPVFAVEVRNSDDYGLKVERNRAAKRSDYFAAGTLVVWDVDILSNDVVRKYQASDPENPIVFRRG